VTSRHHEALYNFANKLSVRLWCVMRGNWLLDPAQLSSRGVECIVGIGGYTADDKDE